MRIPFFSPKPTDGERVQSADHKTIEQVAAPFHQSPAISAAKSKPVAQSPDDDAAADFDVSAGPTNAQPQATPATKPTATTDTDKLKAFAQPLATSQAHLSSVASQTAEDPGPKLVAAAGFSDKIPGLVRAKSTTLPALLAAEAKREATKRDLMSRSLDPGGARAEIDRINRTTPNLTDVSAIEAAAQRKAYLGAVSPADVGAATRILGLDVEQVKVAGRAFLAEAGTVIDGMLADAKASEAAFFASHGLPTEETTVTRRLVGLQNMVARMKESIEHPGPMHGWESHIWLYSIDRLQPLVESGPDLLVGLH